MNNSQNQFSTKLTDMKNIMYLCKFALALTACALPLAVNAQMNGMASNPMTDPPTGNMASDRMMPDNQSSGGMMSDSMMKMAPPKVGEMASDFTLKTLDGEPVRLSDLTAKGKVVLVVLRGWPGYQCPFCTTQVHDYIINAEKLKATGAQVLMVYPGPADDLKAHANEFLSNKSWPKDFLFVMDPDYSFTKSYGLRWEAKNETAYPSTFIINQEGKVTFMHVSKQHGDRVLSESVLKQLNSMPMM